VSARLVLLENIVSYASNAEQPDLISLVDDAVDNYKSGLLNISHFAMHGLVHPQEYCINAFDMPN
jgi:hypothetical protein